MARAEVRRVVQVTMQGSEASRDGHGAGVVVELVASWPRELAIPGLVSSAIVRACSAVVAELLPADTEADGLIGQ